MVRREYILPKYKNPPVIETLLGVQFKPLARFNVPHFGLYWTRIKQEYPSCEVQPPLLPITEQLDESRMRYREPHLRIDQFPEVRCWFIDSSGTRLIQVQKDRFIHNWRKVNDDDVYPSYKTTKPDFVREWERFSTFLDESGFDKPELDQCEVTYVNHIDIKSSGKTYGQLSKVITRWSDEYSNSFLPEPDSINVNVSYLMPYRKGRLHILAQTATRTNDRKEILQLKVIARGKPESSRAEDILDWFDLAHKWVVLGFSDFTTRQIQLEWGLHDGNFDVL